MYENGQCSKINECALRPSACEHGRWCILTRDRFDCCVLNVTRNDTGECTECGLPVNRRQARIVNGNRSFRGVNNSSSSAFLINNQYKEKWTVASLQELRAQEVNIQPESSNPYYCWNGGSN